MEYYYNNELYHFGVKGMKWGVRRYRNYDGSYTKAGLKRYDKSMESYERAKKEYDVLKKDKSASKYAKQYSKSKMKQQKAKLKKDYKHLKQDKMADQGKILYQQGKRIRETKRVNALIRSVGSLTVSAALYGKKLGILNDNAAKKVALVGAVIIGASFVKDHFDEIPNNKLRAYYSHSSNY